MIRKGMAMLAIVVAAGLIAGGCTALGPNSKMARLEKSVQAYSKLVRWGEYERAVAFLEVPRQEAAYASIKSLQNIRVTSYEVKRQVVAPDENSAEFLVQFEFLNDYSGRERQYLDRQRWKWHDKEGSWRLDGMLPAFASFQP